MAKQKQGPSGDNTIARNKKALHDYTVIESCEAGIALRGTEVKSCRNAGVSLVDAFVRIEKGQAWLYNAHIAPYEFGNLFNHKPKSTRRLLLHKREILKLSQQVKEKGYTIVPLKFYFKSGRVKVEIAICKGRTFEDKRDVLRLKQDALDARRAIGRRR
ncbi:MAG: SsrA-binding protein SmpB [Victivallales bacterium]|nr:SsrA-binding protein SmpB [Victivallales bacterium]